MKTDLSPQAVTARLKQTSELRRLCVALGAKRLRARKQTRANKAVQPTPGRAVDLYGSPEKA